MNKTWTEVDLHPGKRSLAPSGCSRLNSRQMGLYRDIKPD